MISKHRKIFTCSYKTMEAQMINIKSCLSEMAPIYYNYLKLSVSYYICAFVRSEYHHWELTSLCSYCRLFLSFCLAMKQKVC